MKNKGTISGFVGIAAIALLLFMASSSVSLQETNSTMLKAQGARELAIKTENVIRLLDKATSHGIYAQLSPPICNSDSTKGSTIIDNYYNPTLAELKNQTGIECVFVGADGSSRDPTFIPVLAEMGGFIECSLTIKNEKISKRQEFQFDKSASSDGAVPPTCIVIDDVSGLTEQP